MNTYGPSEFIQKLKANDLPDDDDVTIAGLVKHDAGADDVIGFSTSMSCESWLTIPTSMIADITHLRTSSAATTSTRSSRSDSSSPIPHRPNSFSYSACFELQRTVVRLTRSTTSGGRVTPLDFDDCYTVIDDGKVKVCCGNPPECTGVADRAQ